MPVTSSSVTGRSRAHYFGRKPTDGIREVLTEMLALNCVVPDRCSAAESS